MSSSAQGQVIRMPITKKDLDKIRKKADDTRKKHSQKLVQVAGGAVSGGIITDLLTKPENYKRNKWGALAGAVGGAILPRDILFSQRGVAHHLVREIISTNLDTFADDWKRVRGRGGTFGGEYSGEAGKILKKATFTGRMVSDLAEYNSRKRASATFPRGFKVTEEGPGTVRVTAPKKTRGRRKKYEWEKTSTQRWLAGGALALGIIGTRRAFGRHGVVTKARGELRAVAAPGAGEPGTYQVAKHLAKNAAARVGDSEIGKFVGRQVKGSRFEGMLGRARQAVASRARGRDPDYQFVPALKRKL